ncbi:MAG: hypothetical protein KR126chlam5_01302 [Candidatus Anoxychlamydiales bacterium]|nr:hypothetical protein [Candidatus Anoxychlamydiales bacterium]
MKNLKFEYQNYKGETKIREVEPKSLKFGLTPNISEKEWLLEAKDVKKNEDRLFVLKNIQRMIDDKIQRFFCVTVYVICEGRFLMLLNRKLKCWVPPGGKVDRHETPDEAALRECLEETGIKIELKGDKSDVDGGLMTPYGIQLNVIDPDKRDHVDIIYLGEPLVKQELMISEREASDIGWFTVKEVLELNTFSSVKQWCKFFYQQVNRSNNDDNPVNSLKGENSYDACSSSK